MECIMDLAQGLAPSKLSSMLAIDIPITIQVSLSTPYAGATKTPMTVGGVTVTIDAGCGHWKQPWIFNSSSWASVRGLDHRRPPTVCSCQTRAGCRGG